MATSKKSAAKAKPVAKKTTPVKSRGLTKPLPVQPKPSKQEPNVSEAYTPQFAGNSFMRMAQSQSL